MKALGIIMLLGLFPLRFAWEAWPGLAICIVFYIFSISAILLCRYFWALPGVVCNGLATLSNGGTMPVYGYNIQDHGVHVQGTADMNLQFLCDIFWGNSLGDILLTIGLIWVLGRAFLKYRQRKTVIAV